MTTRVMPVDFAFKEPLMRTFLSDLVTRTSLMVFNALGVANLFYIKWSEALDTGDVHWLSKNCGSLPPVKDFTQLRRYVRCHGGMTSM
jgi:hypothetical protein